MKFKYDLFEKFPDGSSLWRDSALGLQTARLRLQELAQRPGNEFYAINLTTRGRLPFNSRLDADESCAPINTERRRSRTYGNQVHGNVHAGKLEGEMRNDVATTAVGADRRRSERLLLDVALVVRGESAESQPFREKTFTISVSAHGTLLVLATKVALGQTLLLSNLHSQGEVVGRVVRFGLPRGGLAQVGIDVAQPAPEFWPVESVPDSWTSLRK
jgi:hypothetical protein